MILWRKDDPEFDSLIKTYYRESSITAGIRFEKTVIVWILPDGSEHGYHNKPFTEFVTARPDGPDAKLYHFLKRKYPEMLL